MRRFWNPHTLLVTALAGGAVALVGCGGDDGPTGLDPAQFEMVAVSGGGQEGIAGSVLVQPVRVEVRERSTRAPEEGVSVRWSVIEGDAAATRIRSATDEDGTAATRVEFGATPGAVRVRAEVADLPSITFNLTSLPVPRIESLSVSAADPGDTIEVRVSNLPDALSADVLFDGEESDVLTRTGSSPTVLETVVPPPAGVCQATVDRVDVRVRVTGVTTPGMTLDVTVPDDPFQIGQVLVIQGTDDVQCALLPADGGDARYLLVALNADFEQSGDFEVTLGAENVTIAAADAAPTLQREKVSVHNRLRALEQQLAASGLPPAQPSAGAQLFAEPEVGSEREFWVINNIETTTSQLSEEDFDRITATLEFKGANTLLYVDDDAPEEGLTQADLRFLGELYDRRLYDADVDFFGQPSDVDGNGNRVIALLTPRVNGLNPRGANEITIGFFFGLDLFPANAAGCTPCRFSNEAEMLYGLVPDPNGEFGDARSLEFVRALLPGVFVHETQHMINFRFKVFVHQLSRLETLWLAEAEAHAAEEFGGDELDLAGETELANQLYAGVFSRAFVYLSDPSEHSLTAVEGGGTVGERGAMFLFIRWLAEQFGDFILRDLTQAAPNGVANVEAQTGEDFFRLFADWAVAMWADDLDIPGLADRYQVPKWRLRDILQTDPDGPEEPMYVLQPLEQTFAGFRSDSITRFLAAASPLYVELDAAGDTEDLQLTLDAATEAGLAILRFE